MAPPRAKAVRRGQAGRATPSERSMCNANIIHDRRIDDLAISETAFRTARSGSIQVGAPSSATGAPAGGKGPRHRQTPRVRRPHVRQQQTFPISCRARFEKMKQRLRRRGHRHHRPPALRSGPQGSPRKPARRAGKNFCPCPRRPNHCPDHSCAPRSTDEPHKVFFRPARPRLNRPGPPNSIARRGKSAREKCGSTGNSRPSCSSAERACEPHLTARPAPSKYSAR